MSLPADNRIGRRVADGRFVVTAWQGHSQWMGVAFADDAQMGQKVRLTFAGPSAVEFGPLRARLRGAGEALAEVVHLGPVASDDGWGADCVVLAEVLPPSFAALDVAAVALDAPALARRLAALLRDAHAHGEPLGTLRPESVQLAPSADRWLGSGERLWSLALPLSVGTLSPFAPGYGAPETQTQWPLLAPLAASADVFSLGVIVAEKLLGAFPYPRDSFVGLMRAQYEGKHALLPATSFGALVTRCLAPKPDSRPSVAELLHHESATPKTV